MTLLGWWIITCSGVSLCAVSVQGMISFWLDSFETGRWQTYLIYLATIGVTGKSPPFGVLCSTDPDKFSWPIVHRSQSCSQDHPSNAFSLSFGVLGRLLYAVGAQKADAACFVHYTVRAWYKRLEPRYGMDDGDW